MASLNEVLALANAAQELSNDAKRFVARARQFLSNNSAHSINWATVSDDVNGSVTNGDITGLEFTPADLSNVIGSLDTICDLIEDNGHLGNFEKLAEPVTE